MKTWIRLMPFVVGIFLIAIAASPLPLQAGDNPNPPDEPVKLIFIHHSTGENWLKDDYGNLGRTLDQNNYFISDTNYGWGPDAIGDRTDIPNWPEWFASENTSTYMNALFNESRQNSSYTRTLSDPGGENEIIMFKSCFPNSAMEGHPDDPPDAEGWLSVGHAKYVYNQILPYFASRSDKLFIVITAPPQSDPTYAKNARAFNRWLVNDWLSENNYRVGNVFVFDFYNILTSPDAHHRYNNGQIEHIVGTQDTLYYPSDDDHPSVQGSQKATNEFVALLNIYYHRWQGSAAPPAPAVTEAATQAPVGPVSSVPAASTDLIADFDNVTPYLNAFRDEASSTRISCGVSRDFVYSSPSSLKIDFDVTPGAWATCVLSFDAVQNWSKGEGLLFVIHAGNSGVPYDIDIYSGPQDARETYIHSESTPADSATNWAAVGIRWDQFHRAAWEDESEAAFSKPDQINEIAIGFNGLDAANNTGVIWVDDIRVMQPEQAQPPAQSNQEQGEQQKNKPAIPCTGGIVLPLLFLGLIRLSGRKR